MTSPITPTIGLSDTVLAPPKDGSVFYAVVRLPMKWKAYKPSSQQFKHGIKGRWVTSNGYGGWDIADYEPVEWEPLEALVRQEK